MGTYVEPLDRENIHLGAAKDFVMILQQLNATLNLENYKKASKNTE